MVGGVTGSLCEPVEVRKYTASPDTGWRNGKSAEAHFREEFLEGARIDHRARQAVLTQGPGLLQDGDVEVGHPATSLLVFLDQSGKLDGTGQPRRSGPDDHDVHLDRLGAGGVGRDQAVNWQGGLVANRENAGQTVAPL